MRRMLAGAMALSLASCGTPQAIAPSPRERAVVDWEGLNKISDPSQFRQLEPILEELTGNEPVPADKVLFVDKKKLKEICGETGGTYGGCYAYDKIAFDHKVGVSMWLHEQGHHFDKHLVGEGR